MRCDQSPMARVVKEQDVAILSLINHAVQCLLDVGTSRHDGAARLVYQKLNVIRIKPKPSYEHIVHGLHVVVAATQLVGGVGVVAPHKKCQLLPFLHTHSYCLSYKMRNDGIWGCYLFRQELFAFWCWSKMLLLCKELSEFCVKASTFLGEVTSKLYFRH